MRKKNLTPIFILLFFGFSCAELIQQIKKTDEAQSIKLRPTKKETYCKKNTQGLNLVSENKQTHNEFILFLKLAKEKHSLQFADKVVLWSLIQMIIRPDQSAPTARFDYFINTNGKTHYSGHYSQAEGHVPFLEGLRQILLREKSKYTLEKLALIIDQYHPNQFWIGEAFAHFLKMNKTFILNNRSQYSRYLKADETLKFGERIEKYSLLNMLSAYLKSDNKGLQTQKLTRYRKFDNINIQCNYDLALYDQSIYLINKMNSKSNIFGLEENDNVFMASTGQLIGTKKTSPTSIFWEGQSSQVSQALCQLSTFNQNNNNVWLISTDDRDPGQHLYHLFDYGQMAVRSMPDLDNILRFSRHLFLKNPTRLLFEARQSTKEELEALLKLNVPIYNANNLGNIWGHYKKENFHSFFIDVRNNGDITCQ